MLVILTEICVVASRRETRHRLPSRLALAAVEALLLFFHCLLFLLLMLLIRLLVWQLKWLLEAETSLNSYNN